VKGGGKKKRKFQAAKLHFLLLLQGGAFQGKNAEKWCLLR